jgi:hypothetical protein
MAREFEASHSGTRVDRERMGSTRQFTLDDRLDVRSTQSSNPALLENWPGDGSRTDDEMTR